MVLFGPRLRLDTHRQGGQKGFSRQPTWWYGCLKSGLINDYEISESGPTLILKTRLYDSFRSFVGSGNDLKKKLPRSADQFYIYLWEELRGCDIDKDVRKQENGMFKFCLLMFLIFI